jgi:hypothetical protein
MKAKADCEQVSQVALPRPAINLARRASQLAQNGNGRHVLELIVVEGGWFLIVDRGKLETLGRC